jgi:DNA invertase Pin-like site-specific DNA recombinase
MATYGYVRVSTNRQADEGESLTVQQRTIEGHAMVLGHRLDRMFVERGISGSRPLADRPQGLRLLAALRAGDTVITAKLDRMFRSALDALDVLAGLKERGVSLHMVDLGGDVTGNGISKLVFTILSAVAEAERDRIRERIIDVKQDQRAQGRYLGGSMPFGWRKVDRVGSDGSSVQSFIEPVSEEQRALAKAKHLRSQGKSLRAIELALREDGFRVSHVTIGKALRASARDLRLFRPA